VSFSRLTTLLATISLCLAPVPAAVLADGPLVEETEHFVIEYPGGRDPTLLRQVAVIAEKAYDRVVSDLGIEPAGKIGMTIYGTRQEFAKESPKRDATILLGSFQHTGLPGGYIRLDASRTYQDYEVIIVHEFTHAVVAAACGDDSSRVPLWYNEGLAVFESAKWYERMDDIVDEAVANNTVIPLKDLWFAFPRDSDQTIQAYAEGYSIVKRMTWWKGKRIHAAILGSIKRGSTFDDAIKQQMGVTTNRLETWWLEDLRAHNWRYKLGKLFPELYFFLLAFVAGLAFFMRRRRTKGRAGQVLMYDLEDEEDDENADRPPVWH
jgi:hypothetical protein